MENGCEGHSSALERIRTKKMLESTDRRNAESA